MAFSQKPVTHYNDLKQEVPDCILLMHAGAFMQVTDDDATAVSRITGLKLQMFKLVVPGGLFRPRREC